MAELWIDRPGQRPARETKFPCIAFMQQLDIGKFLEKYPDKEELAHVLVCRTYSRNSEKFYFTAASRVGHGGDAGEDGSTEHPDEHANEGMEVDAAEEEKRQNYLAQGWEDMQKQLREQKEQRIPALRKALMQSISALLHKQQTLSKRSQRAIIRSHQQQRK